MLFKEFGVGLAKTKDTLKHIRVPRFLSNGSNFIKGFRGFSIKGR
jgi:hypothetical protein